MKVKMLDEQVSKSCKEGQKHIEVGDLDNKEISTDLLIIGAGPGGYVAAIYAAKNGLDVTLVERKIRWDLPKCRLYSY